MKNFNSHLNCVFIAVFSLSVSSLFSQDQYKIYNSWNFETESLGEYNDYEVKEDFKVITLYSHNSASIAQEKINGLTTKVLKITHLANTLSVGFDLDAQLAQDFNEVYLTYNIKFSPEFNSTTGGKLPGLGGFPCVRANTFPLPTDGFLCKNMFKPAGKIMTYHYDRTTGTCPWGTGAYNNNPIYFSNGVWYNITRRVKMNTFTNGVANSDGIHELWVDGRLIFKETNLKLMVIDSPTMKIDDINIAHFYGGGSADYKPRTECYGYIDNIVVYTPLDDPTFGTKNTHNPSVILNTPSEITDRSVYFDKLITSAGTLQNTEYGRTYSPGIDEAFLVDAGSGRTVDYKFSWKTGTEDYIFIYDGNTSDSKLLKVIAGNTEGSGQSVSSNGRYMFVRFSSNTDAGSIGFTGTLTFKQTTLPVLNTPPLIGNQNFTASEKNLINNFIGKIIATDTDPGQTLTYSIVSGNESGLFALNSVTGDLTISGNVIFEPDAITRGLQVKVTDNASEPASTTAKITIILIGNSPVVDTNTPPVIDNQQFIITESAFSGNFIGKIIASDADAGQKLSFIIETGNSSGLFAVNSQNGYLSTTKSNIFGPGTKSYELLVKVTDDGQPALYGTASVRIDLKGNSKTVHINPKNSSASLKNSNESQEDGSIDRPFSSWQNVILQEGFTYLQKRGTTTTIGKLLVNANNITLGAYGEGALPVITSESNSYLINGFDKHHIKIQNLHLEVSNAVSCIYFLGSSCDSIIIEHCEITGIAGAVKMSDGKTLILKYNVISGGQVGVYSSASENDINYNIFRNCTEAINVTGNQSKAKIYNNVFADNDRSLSVTYAELTLFNNIFYLTAPGQKALKHGSGKIASNNNIFFPEEDGFIEVADKSFDNLLQLQQDLNLDLNSFNSDPQFVDLIQSNFALEEGSPAINSGKDLELKKDFNGINVPVAGIPDIGIYEFTGTLFNTGVVSGDTSVMTLYPNPSSGEVYIHAEIIWEKSDYPSFERSELKVTDLFGKTIYTRFIERTGPIFQDNIDLSDFSNGFYFIVLQFADKVLKEKLILNK